MHGLVEVADAGAFLARLTRIDPGALVRLRSAGGAATGETPGAEPGETHGAATGAWSSGRRGEPGEIHGAATGAWSSGRRGEPGETPRTALWARLPWRVFVTRDVAGPGPGDATVSAAELLAVLTRGGDELPARHDARWRWPLPPPGAVAVETIAGAELTRLAAAAAGTLREVATGGIGGRAVGQRAVRDALLDHVALVVTTDAGRRVEVPQRLVQAISRMGFLGPSAMDAAQARVYVAGSWVGISAPYGVAWLPIVDKLTVMPIGKRPKV